MKKILYEGPIFTLYQTQVEVNGKMAGRDIIEHPGGVSLSVVKDGKMLFVKQFRPAVNEVTIEIPAGMQEKGELPEVTGMRELNEEAGLECSRLELITCYWPTPGYDTEQVYIYRCIDVKDAAVRLSQDADEDVKAFWMDLDEAYQNVSNGTIRDAKTIMAILDAMLRKEECK